MIEYGDEKFNLVIRRSERVSVKTLGPSSLVYSLTSSS